MTNEVPFAMGEASEIQKDLIMPVMKVSFKEKLWTRLLMVIILVATFAYIKQLTTGLGVTAMRDYSAWGIYISHFVFLVAVSLIGALVTAILKLLKIKWATPLTRISEIISVAAVLFAAITIVVDMGRPDRLLYVFIHGRIQSPIIWDVTVVNTYLIISLILLYLPLIPDIALLRDTLTGKPNWQRKLYTLLAVNWKGTAEQKKVLNRAIGIMLVLVLPVAFSIHTVTSWLFAVNMRAGWNSTIFGPYFVSGAFVVGAAAVIVAMYVYRKTQKLQDYITDYHFDMMGKLLVLTMVIYFYFNINEFLVPGYKMERLEGSELLELFMGGHAPVFWITQIAGLILPILLLVFKPMRKPLPIMLISLVVIAGSWLKRVLIVIPAQFHPQFPIQNVPKNFHYYHPTFFELAITMGIVAGVLLVITVFSRLFPIILVVETEEERHCKIDNKATGR
ncbi:MAG: polysulfide reductase NrfD [Bacteroidia bacterium]|nr:polysulfide reductase NrfD [Bacteroidia bacterium]